MNTGNSNPQIKKVVVAGGGFAGIHLVQKLRKNKNYHIILIDRNNYNYYPPLLYQVSTGFLDASSISYPFRKLFRNKGISYHMADVVKVDPETQTLYLNNGEIHYDYLVLATGCKTNFFGNENIRKNAIPMKTIDDAQRMRNSLYKNLELASISENEREVKKLLTVVVAGGGPTGVEVSGMLAEIRKSIFAKEYPELNGVTGDIYVIDAGPALLGAMSDKSHADAYKVLTRLGVKVILNTQILDYSDERVKLSDGQVIGTKTLIWAAGITGNTFEGIPVTSIGPGKRMITDEFNKVFGLENIYAIGDTSIQMTSHEYPKGHPQMAEVAIQQGNNLANNLIAVANNKPLTPFTYFDQGELAVIGRNYAVADLLKHKLHVRGLPALLIWLGAHLVTLVNFSNILRTLYTWIIAYFSRDQSLRMIFRPETMPDAVVANKDLSVKTLS
jgi:NADH:ubiquinone reductase (H+-translocating)